MIFTLKNADFSKSNIGTLNSWRIVKSLKGVTTESNVVSVNKGASYNAVFNVNEGYVFNSVTITMDGIDISDKLTWNSEKTTATLSISNVTGNVYISIIADVLNDEEEVTKQYTITYKYITSSGQILKVSTTEKVDEGTVKNFNVDDAPEIEGYEVKEVSPTNATINGNTTVSYIYELIVVDDGEDDGGDNKIAVTGIELDKENVQILKGDTVQLTATVLPTDATNKKIIWSTSNSNCSVTSSGLVYGTTIGNCVITARTQDGSFEAQCNVTVSHTVWYIDVASNSAMDTKSSNKDGSIAFAYVDSVNAACIGKPINMLRLAVAQAGALTYGKVSSSEFVTLGTIELVNPSKELQIYEIPEITLVEGEKLWFQNTGDTGLFYYQDKNVDGTGSFLWGVKESSPGTVTRSNLSIDIGYMILDESDFPVTGIELNRQELIISVGESVQLTANVLPAYATNTNVIWSASNTNCSVLSGLVTGNIMGNCIITARTQDGGFEAQCNVKVLNWSLAEWYIDVASNSAMDTKSSNQEGSIAFAYVDSVNAACIGKPINALRLAVAQAGALTYGKKSDTEFVTLGTIKLINPSKELQAYEIPEITLAEGEKLWFQNTGDTGLFYYQNNNVDGTGSFLWGVKESSPGTATQSNLSIDIGYLPFE